MVHSVLVQVITYIAGQKQNSYAVNFNDNPVSKYGYINV